MIFCHVWFPKAFLIAVSLGVYAMLTMGLAMKGLDNTVFVVGLKTGWNFWFRILRSFTIFFPATAHSSFGHPFLLVGFACSIGWSAG